MPDQNLMPRVQARKETADVPVTGSAPTASSRDVLDASFPARAPAADANAEPSIRDLKLRLLLCGSSSALGLVIASARSPVPGGLSAALSVAALALVAYAGVWCALPLHQRSLRALLGAHPPSGTATLARRIDPALPGSLAVLLGVAVSALWSLTGVNSERTFYALLVVWAVTTSVLSSALIEQLSRRLASRARTQLLRLLPEQARRLDDTGREEIVPLGALAPGDLLRVRPRELIPADGVVLDGRSAVQERGVTGEPLPVDKRAGAALIGGTLNGRGNLLMRVCRSGPDTLLAALARLLSQAEQTRAQHEHSAERASGALAVGALGLAALVALIHLASAEPVDPGLLLLASCTLLALASPRSLAHATSLAFGLGLARAARAGVIVRSATSFEALAAIDTIVVDKTGTLTEARPRVISVVTTEHVSEPRLLSIAAGLLDGTHHHVAAAVATRAETLGVPGASIRGRERVPGAGLVGHLNEEGEQREVALGSLRLLETLGVRDVTLEGKAEALCDHGQTVLFVLLGRRVCGLIGVLDPIGLTTRDALRELEEEGTQLVLCSSDAQRTTQHLGGQLGLGEVYGDKLPHEKAELVADLRRAGRRVAFASRSVDEDEARAAAHLSFQMNLERELGGACEPGAVAHPQGTEPAWDGAAAAASTQVNLVRGDLAALTRALRLARLTVRSARRSLQLGLAYHLFALLLGVGIFHPMWDISLGPVQASMASVGCFALLTWRALRLRAAEL
jgi:Cu+-exporting ATPase